MTQTDLRPERIKVAVLGGGMAGLAAAWQLTQLDRRRYDITVYQRGWRLGGKGASGRNRQPGKGLRIEEHGLHILMGFYDHVFHILKTCYEDLGDIPDNSPHGAIGSWKNALIGSSHLHVCDRYRDGHSEIWELHLPTNSAEVPGTHAPADPDIAVWIRNGLSFIYEILRQGTGHSATTAHLPEREGPAPGGRWLDWLARTLVRRENDPQRLRATLLGHGTRSCIRWALSLLFRRLGDPERRDPTTIARRRQLITAYFVGANLLGILDNRLWCKQDFLRAAERLDGLDYREWLRRNTWPIGERWPELAWDSALVKSVYDLIFSRHSGFGAGTALYDTLCMLLNYRGQVYYRMNGGTGDVVFAPLYLWLRQRGVKFRFFERVRKLAVESGGDVSSTDGSINQIVLEDQLHLAPGEEYDPLFEAAGRACWPSQPLWERLPPAEARRARNAGYDFETSSEPFGEGRVLQRGRDFDLAVLAIPVGVFQEEPELAGDLARAHPPFAEMVQGLQTVPTRAFQIWTEVDSRAMGWSGRPGMLGAFQPPFASWADMSQLLDRESWEGAGRVKGVHYFCGTHLGTPAESEQQAAAEVMADARQWLRTSWPSLLPGWRWDHLSATDSADQDRFAEQYCRANISPSDRYVLAAPGTLRFRLPPDRSGFENLYLAGDWVKTDLNAGCVEAAAMAGVGAARAIHARRGPLLPLGGRASPKPLRAPARPRYIDRDSDWVLRAPVRAESVTTALFALRADPEALGALCLDLVDRPSAGAVTAHPWPSRAGLVLLVCSNLPHVASDDEEHGQVGYFQEHDVGFFVPVAVDRKTGPPVVRLLAPYLFVDSAIGLSAGREIYGFSKVLARIDMPAPYPGRGFALPPAITVVADVLDPDARPGGPWSNRVEQATVLEVIPVPGSLAGRPTSTRTRALPVPAQPALWQFLPLFGRALTALDWSLGQRQRPRRSFQMPLLFLKQFRDAESALEACHQSLVECPAQAALTGAPRRLQGRFVVRLPRHDKPDLARTLGLPTELETSLAIQLSHDLLLPHGSQIWPAP